MKINPNAPPPQVSAPRTEPKATASQAIPAPASKGWQPKTAAAAATPAGADPAAAKKALTGLATAAVAKAIAQAPTGPVTHPHPMLEGFGEALGLSLGVVVTEALSLVPSWNKPVLDAAGKPVAHVEGADRQGSHDLLKRHQEVVGPKVAALVEKLSPGAIHDLLEGFGKGASAAPGASYRLENAVSDLFKR